MKKLIIAATVIGFSMGGAFAQTTGPAAHMKTNSTISKDGMKKGTSGMSKDSMSKDGMKKETTGSSMQNPANGTTGKSGGEGGSGR